MSFFLEPSFIKMALLVCGFSCFFEVVFNIIFATDIYRELQSTRRSSFGRTKEEFAENYSNFRNYIRSTRYLSDFWKTIDFNFVPPKDYSSKNTVRVLHNPINLFSAESVKGFMHLNSPSRYSRPIAVMVCLFVSGLMFVALMSSAGINFDSILITDRVQMELNIFEALKGAASIGIFFFSALTIFGVGYCINALIFIRVATYIESWGYQLSELTEYVSQQQVSLLNVMQSDVSHHKLDKLNEAIEVGFSQLLKSQSKMKFNADSNGYPKLKGASTNGVSEAFVMEMGQEIMNLQPSVNMPNLD